MRRKMESKAMAELAVEAEYLRLRCGILEQVDRDMFGRGLAAGAACDRAAEAFSGSDRRMWVRGILAGILARRNPEASASRPEKAEEFRRWMAGGEFAALPPRVREWMGRDMRVAEGLPGCGGEGDVEPAGCE